MSTNDNDVAIRALMPVPDPHGHAALLLAESLIHGLIARSIISNGAAVEIVESAQTVQADIAEEADGAGAPMWRSHALLAAIADSLRVDGDGVAPSIHPIP